MNVVPEETHFCYNLHKLHSPPEVTDVFKTGKIMFLQTFLQGK